MKGVVWPVSFVLQSSDCKNTIKPLLTQVEVMICQSANGDYDWEFHGYSFDRISLEYTCNLLEDLHAEISMQMGKIST